MTERNTLRRRIERLILSLPHPDSPASDLEEATTALANLRSGANALSASAFRSIHSAEKEMQFEAGPDFRVIDYFDTLIRESDEAGVEGDRIEVARRLAGVADDARSRGLWIEYLLLSRLTWVIAEPTGIAISALRQQLYIDPVTVPLLVEFYDGSCGPIAAATDLASALRRLSGAVRSKTAGISNLPTN